MATKTRTRKVASKKQDYCVSVRLDPKAGHSARMIRDVSILSDPSGLYRRLATLEAYLAQTHPDWNSYVVDVSPKGDFRLADEHTKLSDIERKKIDKYLPLMLTEPYSKLDKLTDDFVLSGVTHYIG